MELNQTKEAKEIIDIVQNRELTSLSYNKSKTITTEIYVNVNEIQFARIFFPSSLFDEPMRTFLCEVMLITHTLLGE